ncbi:hypothetical protein [Amycolatopsis australiensis]|uniref:Uncharacterized protein n=1 Tax=Amycolatopsis australiensis TaxID=546364 RepID=A0A1K1SPS6_9PSEU|nr:hypothetical protein [Amycolatopsis australiensis]SFW86323.1 hypothetical protein SAMN04489730_6360 [Amycolatopsis australiensis]
MTETTTLHAGAPPASVTIEPDATPLVRLIGRTLRDSVRIGHESDTLSQATGTVALRSHDTPQAATITFRDAEIAVTSGVSVEPDATVVADLRARFSPAQEPAGNTQLADVALRALTPPLPPWREAARRFWDLARGITGIPDVLVVVSEGESEERFGAGASEYLIAGSPDVLAGVLTGADDFLAALTSGLHVKGTWAQLSVMTAAFWKVRFDV